MAARSAFPKMRGSVVDTGRPASDHPTAPQMPTGSRGTGANIGGFSCDPRPAAFGGTFATWQGDYVKARFDDHVITVTEVALPDGHVLAERKEPSPKRRVISKTWLDLVLHTRSAPVAWAAAHS